jgi:hypothetical protein
MAHLVLLIAVMAGGKYNIGNRFQITYIVNPPHNHDSNFFGCNCDGGCRRGFKLATIQSKQNLESIKSYLCVEVSFLYIYEDAYAFPERTVNRGG